MSEIQGVPEGKRLVSVKPCECGMAGCNMYTATLEDIPKPKKQVLVLELEVSDERCGPNVITPSGAEYWLRNGGRIEEREA